MPLSLEEARRIVADYVNYYNEIRLRSAIGYITPKDKIEGKAEKIAGERKKKMEEAKKRRMLNWELTQNKPSEKIS